MQHQFDSFVLKLTYNKLSILGDRQHDEPVGDGKRTIFCDMLDTVDSEIFARILFPRIALKDIY